MSSDCFPAQLSIDLDTVRGYTGDNSYVTLGDLKAVAPWGLLRRGYFDTTYVDEMLRVSRGPTGELRVFERII